MVFFFISAHASAMSVEKYEKSKKESPQLTILYMQGTGYAFSWMNTIRKERGEKASFFPPNKLVIQAQNYIDILDEEIKLFRKLESTKESELLKFDIEPLLFFGLEKTFPCPK